MSNVTETEYEVFGDEVRLVPQPVLAITRIESHHFDWGTVVRPSPPNRTRKWRIISTHFIENPAQDSPSAMLIVWLSE